MSTEDPSPSSEPNPGGGRGEEERPAGNGVPPPPPATEENQNAEERQRAGAPPEKGDVRVVLDGGATPADGAATGASTSAAAVEEEVPMTFAQRLMEMLSNEESNSSIITWLPHGRGWIIRDKKRLAAELLPKYFTRQSKFASFTRKLNRWNFTRVTRGPELGAYYHPLFQRDKPELVLQMSCIDSKSPQRLQPLNPIALGYGAMMPDLICDPLSFPYLQSYAPFPQQQQQPMDLVSMPLTSPAVGKPEGDAPAHTPSGAGPQVAGQVGASEPGAAADPSGVAGKGPGSTLATPAVEDPAYAAYLSYQAEYCARMMAQQQQAASGSSMLSPLLAPDQMPLPLPPTSKKFALRESQSQQPPQQQQQEPPSDPQQASAPPIPPRHSAVL